VSQMFESSAERSQGCLQGCALSYETNDVPDSLSWNSTRRSSGNAVGAIKLPISPVPHTPHDTVNVLFGVNAHMENAQSVQYGYWGPSYAPA
jgi:hypothetical protein